jgi:signal peptidase I
VDGLHLIRGLARAVAFVAALAAVGALGFLALTERQPIVERTGSMAPLITEGDVLVVHHRAAASSGRGDVVTFAHPSRPGQTMTHRVTAVAAAPGGTLKVTTRGDANPAGET